MNRAHPGSRSRDCPICGGSGEPWGLAADRDRRSSSELFEYRRCAACSTLFQANVPVDLERAYAGSDYYALLPPGPAMDRASADREEMAGEVLRSLRARGHVGTPRLLDVGAGRGLFAYQCRKRGFDVRAIEMDQSCVEHLSSVLGVPTVRTSDPAASIAEAGPLDAITFVHVLEHLPNPRAALEASVTALVNGGIMLVAVPNPQALQLKLFGARWIHLDPPRHLQLPPVSALVEMCRTLGLEPLSISTGGRIGAECNDFGWRRSAMNLARAASARRALSRVGGAIGSLVAPVERRALHGSSYVAWFGRGKSFRGERPGEGVSS